MPECQHYVKDYSKNDQIQAFEDRQERKANGEKQTRCRICKRYVWDSMWFAAALEGEPDE